MLKHLAIRDIVLVRRLDLELPPGLCVLTGETGAGKSIILDALGLALGDRAERGLLRAGAEQGTVAARFEAPANHPAWSMLAEQSIEEEGEIVLRRVLMADGRSRAFVNDQPVTGQLLRRLGDSLVELHGQNEQRGLLNAGVHRDFLDAFGGLEAEVTAVAEAHGALRQARGDVASLRTGLEVARREEDYLRHLVHELQELAVRPGEEEELAARRQQLMNLEKLTAAIAEATAAVAGRGGARERLMGAERRLERVVPLADSLLADASAALTRALVELDEAEATLAAAAHAIAADGTRLDQVEERLFALRDAARKHHRAVDLLPDLLAESEALLARLDHGAESLIEAERRAKRAAEAYAAAAGELSQGRRAAAGRLAEAVMVELPPLRLERVQFRVAVAPSDTDEPGPAGVDHVAFEVSTNPGQPFGPLARIASGGELSRLVLALKVVLARIGAAETLVFDEIDAGIGGAVADAVGERLARLGEERQVLVVTHAPQVAARGASHFTVRKELRRTEALVEVGQLSAGEREDEIARMLAGASITDAARAAARSLLTR